MDRQRADPNSLPACVERHREQGIRRLGLTVRDPLVVWPPLEVRIVEIDMCSSSTRAMPASAARALSGVRAGTITVAPADERARVVSSPTPAYPPVTTAVTPSSLRLPITSRAVVCAP